MAMARTRGLTVKLIENLQARDARYEIPDPGCPGLYLVVHPTGAKSWAYRYRFAGLSRKLTVGPAFTDEGIEVISIGDARDVADEARVSVARRIDPIEVERQNRKKAAAEKASAANTLRAVAEKYLGQQDGLRSIGHLRKVFERLIYPALGDRPIDSIKRSDVVKMLDDIAASRGAAMADKTLAIIRTVCNWHASRSDDFRSPIVRGMARTKSHERARTRILTDAELRVVWAVAAGQGAFGRLVRFLLLTGARRTEAAAMPWAELDGVDWLLPGPRNKTKLELLRPLPPAVLDVIGTKPNGTVFVFSNDGGAGPIRGYGPLKAAFDDAVIAQLRKGNAKAEPLPRWTLHDLRRTARSLMSRAGVSSDHAERCLGHVIGGVRGVYDRHEYRDEKARAYVALAELVERIVDPGSNVVAFAERTSVNSR
jgi:integrase